MGKKMDAKKLYDKVNRLREDKGWTANYLCKQAGISHSTMYNWKKRGTVPSLEILECIADIFNISLFQLFSENEVKVEISKDEELLLEYWSTMNREQQQAVFALLRAFRK